MPTTVLATALPHSLAEGAPFHLTIFLTHKLVGGTTLADFPAAAQWPSALARCTLALETSLGTSIPLQIVSIPDADSWSALLPPSTPVDTFPTPTPSDKTWHTNPASRMSDHAVDLHVAAITASPTHRPRLADNPVASGLLRTLADLDEDGPLRQLLDGEEERAARTRQIVRQRLQDALTTLGPLSENDEFDPERGDRGEIPPLLPYQSEIVDLASPVQVLLDDPEADTRVTQQLDGLVGHDLAADPLRQMITDAHAMRRYYERPEQPQQTPRAEPDPNATATPRPDRPEHDFHAKVSSFGATPALLRRLGLAVDVVLEGLDPVEAQAALAGATWVSVRLTSPDPDLQVLPPRKISVVVDGPVFTMKSSDAWVGGALPLGDPDWVVLDVDPDTSGLKLDQYVRNLARQYASEANGDPATSAPGTLRSTGFALARRERADQLRTRVTEAERLAVDDGSRELLLDDLVRGIRVEVWDNVTGAWHSLHRRLVTVTASPSDFPVLTDEPDVGFLQLSALNRAPGDQTNGYYLHEVVAGWDGWSLSAPRPGLTIVHVEPPGPDGATEAVVDAVPDEPLKGAHTVSRVASGSLPRLRYGMSYSFRILAVDLAGNSVPHIPSQLRRQTPPGERAVAAARLHLERLSEAYERRDRGGVAEARRAAVVEHLRANTSTDAQIPDELLSGDARIDAVLQNLMAQMPAPDDAAPAQRVFDDIAEATRILAESRHPLRVRPQLRIDAEEFAALAANDDLQLPDDVRVATRPVVTTPRPYLRWDPIPAPALVARNELTAGEQLAVLVVRDGGPTTSERHLAPPKATQLEAEAAGEFDTAIGTGDAAEIRRLYAIALAERGTFLDQFVPSLTDARATDQQPGIALFDRPGADIGSEHRATLADITAVRGRPIGEGQYVVHDTEALRLPYLPDPYATGISLVFYEAGAPHVLPEVRALQSVTVPYPGEWPSRQALRLVVESGPTLGARVVDHVIHVQLPPGEQVRVAVSSTLDMGSLHKFGLWQSHRASVVDPADGYTTDEVVAVAALIRAASCGWTWWLTPSAGVRLVHAVPEPVRPPELSALSLFLRPPGRSVAALSGLVHVHGTSTDTLVVTASWSETVDDISASAPQVVSKSDVVVRSTVGERENIGLLYLYDLVPTGPLAQELPGIQFHRMLQTFEDTHYRRVTYVPTGETRYAEFFTAEQLAGEPTPGESVVLDIPSSARPAAPVVLDAVPLLRWESTPEPDDPFAWRRVRRSGVRLWLARPWFSSGDGELLGVLVFDPHELVKNDDGTWTRQPKEFSVPDGATSLWAADPIMQHGGSTSDPTVPPLLKLEDLILDIAETAAAESLGIQPPIQGQVHGGRDRGWLKGPGDPVTVEGAVPLRDVPEHPVVRVLGYRPEFDEDSGRWFVDISLHETRALWPFLRLAVARFQPHSIDGCSLSPIALSSWVQPLPTRTLTVSRPDSEHVQVTLSGVVSWLRFDRDGASTLPGEELSADSPTGRAAARAIRLQESRMVRASVQHRAAGAGDLEWTQVSASVVLHAVSVEESGDFRATWTGTVWLPWSLGYPGMRQPGAVDSDWRVLVEEHELLTTDPSFSGAEPGRAKRLVYADEVSL